MSLVKVLIYKDLRLHWKSLIGFWTAWAAIVLVAFEASAPESLFQRQILIVNGQLCFLLLYLETFVAREKVKGTLAWVRSLPVSEQQIVASKMIVFCAVEILGGVGLIGVSSVGWPLESRLLFILMSISTVLLLGAGVLFARWVFAFKTAAVVPFAAVVVILLMLKTARRQWPDFGRILELTVQSPSTQLAVIGVELGMLALLWWGIGVILTERDVTDWSE